ncbi:MAG: NAD(P)/FAD-dependent oxidoreductase [Acidimicrobiales bacterium]
MVVGGGIVGTSALYHLAVGGCRDVVLLERDTLGSGSTGAAAGGVRAQFSDELNIRIALESIARFSRFEDEIGADIGFHQSGYLFLLQADAVPTFEASVALQRSLGVPSQLITPAEAATMVPQLRVDDLAAATFCSIDGTADPGAVVAGYASAARQLGARILQGTAATAVVVESDRVVAVETTRGRITTASVICAAGIWSPAVAATAGVDLPVRAERRYVYLTAQGDDLPAEIPLTIDFATTLYFHRERPGLLVGGPWATLDELAPVALGRVPAFADLSIRPGWSGNYEMSPDHNAIVGAASSPQGFLYATGFSGHGFQQGPVVGSYLADLVLGRTPVIDLGPLSVDRFADHAPRAETNVV